MNQRMYEEVVRSVVGGGQDSYLKLVTTLQESLGEQSLHIKALERRIGLLTEMNDALKRIGEHSATSIARLEEIVGYKDALIAHLERVIDDAGASVLIAAWRSTPAPGDAAAPSPPVDRPETTTEEHC